MTTLTGTEVQQVVGGSVTGDLKAIGHAIADGAETAAGAIVGFFKGLF